MTTGRPSLNEYPRNLASVKTETAAPAWAVAGEMGHTEDAATRIVLVTHRRRRPEGWRARTVTGRRPCQGGAGVDLPAAGPG